MNNTISVYELLGLIKDGKAPKKIKYNGEIWKFIYKNTISEDYDYQDEYGNYLLLEILKNNYLTSIFNEEVEILEEDKPIIEKLNLDREPLKGKEVPRAIDYLLEGRINEIIDYINRKEDN